MDSVEISMQSDTTIYLSFASPSTVFQYSSVDQQVMDQFAQMKKQAINISQPSATTWHLRWRP